MPQGTGSQKTQSYVFLLSLPFLSFLCKIMCMSIASGVSIYREDVPGGQRVLGQLQVVVGCLPWVLGHTLGSIERVVHTLDHQAISSAISMNHLHKNCSKKDYKRHSDANSIISLPCLLSSALKHLSLCISRSYSLPIIKSIKFQTGRRVDKNPDMLVCTHSFTHWLHLGFLLSFIYSLMLVYGRFGCQTLSLMHLLFCLCGLWWEWYQGVWRTLLPITPNCPHPSSHLHLSFRSNWP